MDPESQKGVIHPQNTPSSKKKNKRPSSNENKEKRKKRFSVPSKLLASLWWIATFVTFTIGLLGIVKVILQIYLRGSPDWNYALIINPDYDKIEMAVYTFKGMKRDLNIRHMENVSMYENLEYNGITSEIKNTFRRAVKIIPWLSRSSSPVIVAAAGNMRMIKKFNKDNYERYMDELKQLIQNSPLKYFPQSLSTLNDWEEALYGWVSLNYLSDYMIKGRQPIKSKRDIFTTTITSGGLELDQTSLHVSYEIPRLLDSINLENGVKENTRVITLYGRVYHIYTKTLQCFGSKRIMNMYLTYNMEEKELDTRKFYWIYNGYHCSVEKRYGKLHFVGRTGDEDTYEIGEPIAIPKYRLNGTCTNAKVATEKLMEYHGHPWLYFFGPSDAEKCFNDVKEIIDNCKTHFQDNCPDFTFPKRPYDVTFTVFNEFAIYAKLAGLKSGDSKTTWDEKRKKICAYDCIKNLKTDFPGNTAATEFHFRSLCLMMNYLYYFLDVKLKLTDNEWTKLIIAQYVDDTKISWYLGYVANITNALPTTTPFYGEVSLQNLFIEGIIFTTILSISSGTIAFALRNSNVLAVRPLSIPC